MTGTPGLCSGARSRITRPFALGKRVGDAFIQCWACGRQVSALSQEEGLTASAFGGEEALLSFGAE